SIVPAVARANSRDAAKADAHAAGHRRLERQVTGRAPARGEGGKRFHHRLGTAADQMLGFDLLFQKLGDKTAKPQAAIVGRNMDFCARGAEVVDPRREIDAADTVVKRHTSKPLPRGIAAVAALSKQLTRVSEEWCLANAAGNQP